MEALLRVTSLGASLTVKWYSYLFLRLLPLGYLPKLGYHYLPYIFTASAIYIVSFILLHAARPDKRRKPSLFGAVLALVNGVYTPAHPTLSLVGGFITLLFPLMSADFVLRTHLFYPSKDASFSRVGWVTEHTADLLLRSPVAEPVTLQYWVAESDDVPFTTTLSGGNQTTDFTFPAHLSGLAAGTAYAYNTSAGHRGSFSTRGDNEKTAFTLLSTSCQKPGWPYSPLDHPLKIGGLEYLDQVVQKMKRKPEAMLFLGDFIYSDLPFPLSDYTDTYYRMLYRQVYSSPSWTPLLRSIPWLHMFDDHEIINDYSPSSKEMTDMFANAMGPYKSYQQAVNPPAISATQPTYFNFDIGQVSFFMLDNRSFRTPQPARTGANTTAGFGQRSMLGAEQLEAVKIWVAEGNKSGKLLVLVSGVPLTRNWSGGSDEFDTWAGYLDEREEILELLWASGGAVVISGDRHEHGTTLFPPPASSPHPYSSSVIEFSTSPLSMFYQPWARAYIPHLPTDVPIHVHWEGYSRFGVFDFDTSNGEQKVVFKHMVAGEQEWEFEWVKGREVEVPEVWQS
ncbi:hypothetical protein IAT38_005426 [Cryptococcus sp. DSM 104549]